MRKLIVIILAAVTMAGCSEMRIMTTAAFKEMGSDIVNLEEESYRQRNGETYKTDIVAQAGAEKK